VEGVIIVDTDHRWKMIISAKVAKQLSTYRKLTTLEIGGLGLERTGLAPDPNNSHTFYLTKIWPMSIGEDSTSNSYCEIPPEKNNALMNRLAVNGKAHLLKLWWHIHPISTWSGTDVSTMRQRVEEFYIGNQVNWALSLVLTPSGYIARYDQAGKKSEDCWFIDLPASVAPKEEHAWVYHVKQLEKLKPPKPIIPSTKYVSWTPSKSTTNFPPWEDHGIPDYKQESFEFMNRIEYGSEYFDTLNEMIEERANHKGPMYQCDLSGDDVNSDICSVCGLACRCFGIDAEMVLDKMTAPQKPISWYSTLEEDWGGA
jgi:hypothetical protein